MIIKHIPSSIYDATTRAILTYERSTPTDQLKIIKVKGIGQRVGYSKFRMEVSDDN